MTPVARIYVVTYRRPHLLRRALKSLILQTRTDWVAEVLNDDPEDDRVDSLVAELGDSRVQLSKPPLRRGGTGNFNYAFRSVAEPFAAILEDDNWWQPDFLADMVSALQRHPDVALGCCNERIWVEQTDGSWVDTGRNVWPLTGGEQLFEWKPSDKCGSAKLCNSALLFRTSKAESMQTPSEIPIDVTEHFRERVVPHPFLLVNKPLVNYAETRDTHRSRDGTTWSMYQVMLIGSVFALAPSGCRKQLAMSLWRRSREGQPLFATALLSTAWFVPDARALWAEAGLGDKMRFAAHALRRWQSMLALRHALIKREAEWQWLLQGPFAKLIGSHASGTRANLH